MIFTTKTKIYSKAFIHHFYNNNPLKLPYKEYQTWLNDLPNQKKHFLILSLASVPTTLKATLIDQILKPYHLEKPEKKLLSFYTQKKNLLYCPTSSHTFAINTKKPTINKNGSLPVQKH